jgi:hypothetical protein
MTVDESLAPQQPGRVGFTEIRDSPVATPTVAPTAKHSWRFPVTITVTAVAIYAIVFALLIQRSGPDDEPTASPPSTAAATNPDATSVLSSSTTAIAVSTTTTTTTTATTTTTTTTIPPIPAVGEPIALEDLTLGAFTLGPLAFGDRETDAVGRLVSTFGQPDDVYVIGEADGLCPTESGRAARFGWLTALLRQEGEVEVLVGYLVEEPQEGAAGHPASELKTISGGAIGDTVADWTRIYRTSTVTEDVIDGVPVLMLLRSNDKRTLLWGPLTDDEPATILGVFSPRPCDGGPQVTTS